MDTKERLLAGGYKVYHVSGEVYIYSPIGVLMGCGYTDSEAWTEVFHGLLTTVAELFAGIDQQDALEAGYFEQFTGDVS